jgi:hypothetical protein
MMESTIERAQTASGKKATLYGPKGVEHSLFTGKKITNETMITSTIRQAQKNIIARAQVAATIKPMPNDRVPIRPNTMTGKNLTEKLNKFASKFTVFRNQIMVEFKSKLTKIPSGAGSKQTNGEDGCNTSAQAEST